MTTFMHVYLRRFWFSYITVFKARMLQYGQFSWRLVAIILTVALLTSPLSVLQPGTASAATQAGLLSIDPNDSHRLLMDGQPFYLAGYYPTIAALTHDQTDYTNYYRTLIDKLAANRINYMRAVFDMGQPYGDAMTLYQRTGPGTAIDGRPKFDLTKFNQTYFDYWRQVISYARSKGVVVQLVITDSWHNKAGIVSDSGGLKVWGMVYDYYNGANNINGLDASSNSNWHSPSHPSFNYHKEVIRRVVDNLGDLPNIVYEISNENYTSADWERQLADYLTSYEASKGRARHLVMPRDLPNHDEAGAKNVDPGRTHSAFVSNYSKNKVLIADNDGGGDGDPTLRRKRAWAALTGGGYINYFHPDIRDINVLNSQDATDGMRYVGYTAKLISDYNIDLRGMKPSDSLVSNGWALAKAGERFIIYLISGGSTTVSELPTGYTAVWFNPRTGDAQSASGGPKFTAPDGKDWVLYITNSGGVNPSPSPTPAPRVSGGVPIRINFQTSSKIPGDGVQVDTGAIYGDRGNGYTFGWNTDNSANARNRNAPNSPNEYYDTLNHFQLANNFIWEIALPNGTYMIRIVAGDPDNYDSLYKIKAEDVTVISGSPDNQNRWVEGVALVKVTDGRLTLQSAGDAVNNKINYIDIKTPGINGGHSIFLPSVANP